MKRHTVCFAALTAILAAAPAAAHEFFQVVGTVVSRAVDKNNTITIEIKTSEGGTVTLYLVKQVQVTRNGASVPESEVKAGANVDIETFGDSYDYADALVVRLLPK